MALPPELVDRIIDYLHSDKPALAACALVCRTWVPASRFYFWETLHITPDTISTLLKLLNSPTCTITEQVCTVEILTGDSWEFVVESNQRENLNRLASATSLLLRGSDLGDTSGEAFRDLCRSFTGVRKLDLRSWVPESPNDVCELIMSFPALERLDMKMDWSIEAHELDGLRTFTFPPHLRILDLCVQYRGVSMFSWLISNARFPSLSEVKLKYITPWDFDAAQSLLYVLGPSLEKFDIKFTFDGGKSAIILLCDPLNSRIIAKGCKNITVLISQEIPTSGLLA
jgi:F-box-like